MLSKEQFYIKFLKNDFYCFLKKSFRTLNPNVEFVENWHIELICLYLEAIEKSEIRRLIINVPPRSLKSTIVNISYPAWLLARKPSEKIISGSFNQTLSLDNNIKTRTILESAWYQTAFPNSALKFGINKQEHFETIEGGYKKAGTLASPPTGSGGDYIIIDDPHNTKEVESEKDRKSAIQSFNTGFTTRLNDKKTGRFIVIMQRLHEDDLTGHLLSKDKSWVHLKIPAIANKDYTYYYPNSEKIFKVFKEGEYLNSKREGEEEIKQSKIDMGQYAFAGQYMQEPSPSGGAIIKNEWIRYYKEEPIFEYRIITADTAMKTGQNNDYSVLQCWGISNNGYYLIDQLRSKMESPNLINNTINFWNKHIEGTGKLRVLLIEDKASGIGLIQTLKQKNNIPVKPVKPEKDKELRLRDVAPIFESEKVFFKEEMEYNSDLVNELIMFPNCKHDDQVDAICYALAYLSQKIVRAPRAHIM